MRMHTYTPQATEPTSTLCSIYTLHTLDWLFSVFTNHSWQSHGKHFAQDLVHSFSWIGPAGLTEEMQLSVWLLLDHGGLKDMPQLSTTSTTSPSPHSQKGQLKKAWIFFLVGGGGGGGGVRGLKKLRGLGTCNSFFFILKALHQHKIFYSL